MEHSCQVCNKKFNLKSNLNRHLKIHDEDNRINECHYCNEKFVRYNDLTRHHTFCKAKQNHDNNALKQKKLDQIIDVVNNKLNTIENMRNDMETNNKAVKDLIKETKEITDKIVGMVNIFNNGKNGHVDIVGDQNHVDLSRIVNNFQIIIDNVNFMNNRIGLLQKCCINNATSLNDLIDVSNPIIVEYIGDSEKQIDTLLDDLESYSKQVEDNLYFCKLNNIAKDICINENPTLQTIWSGDIGEDNKRELLTKIKSENSVSWETNNRELAFKLIYGKLMIKTIRIFQTYKEANQNSKNKDVIERIKRIDTFINDGYDPSDECKETMMKSLSDSVYLGINKILDIQKLSNTNEDDYAVILDDEIESDNYDNHNYKFTV